MADTAFQTKYRQEYIQAYEVHQSLLRKTVCVEADINGNQAVFLVAGSGGASAVTRGVNGLIPYRANDLTQTTATLAEWHDGVRMTKFNIYASQGNQRQIMQRNTVGVINRKIDADIIAALETGTQDTGTTGVMSLDLVMYAKAILGNAKVPADGNLFFLISPAAEAYLMQVPAFSNREYTSRAPFDNPTGILDSFRWAGFNFIVHPTLTGAGTNAEKCIAYHREAVGHAIDMDRLDTEVGYVGEHQYSWARASAFMGSIKLQNTGIVIVNHDGSAYAAQ